MELQFGARSFVYCLEESRHENIQTLRLYAFVCDARNDTDTSAVAAQEGEASYYADSLNGSKTASGELYDKDALSAAHRSLPFGTKVRVTYLETGCSVVVVINDRGPYAKDRIIDLSAAAVRQIGLIDAGHGRVGLAAIEP